MAMTRRSTCFQRLVTPLLTLYALSHVALVCARGINVNLTATWPSSPLYPLLETSEFLAEENPKLFWRFVDTLAAHKSAIAKKSEDADALTQFAVDLAQEVAPNTKNILELTVATRMYSVRVEMFRQLGLDSGSRLCGPDAEAWAVFYQTKRCVTAVACSPDEITAALATLESDSSQTCLAAGMNDVELEVDHKYPQSGDVTKSTVILYGLIGTSSFYKFHDEFASLAKQGEVTYIARHFPKDAPLGTALQGYGIALDIKNMEYKTIDDSKKANEEPEAGEEEEDEFDTAEDDDEDTEAEEDVDGLFFSTLIKNHGEIEQEIKEFRDALVQQHDQEQDIKAWHLKNIGIAAAREILDSKNPLKRLRVLSQDFPKHAKKLAFSRKPLSDELRQEIELRRTEAVQAGLLDRFLINGIAINPTQRSFNIFDFMEELKAEWSVAKKIAALPLDVKEREEMLAHVRETKQESGAARIRVRGAVDGTAPLYLNDIEADHMSAQWSTNVGNLRQHAWNLIFIRKNMYEYVIAFDPMSPHGRTALKQASFLRMRGAPLQWGFLVSTKELVAARTREDRAAIVEQYKLASLGDKATGWHFAKLLILVKSKEKDVEPDERGRIVTAFIEGVADEPGDISVQTLIDCYVDATGGSLGHGENKKEALGVLHGDLLDEEAMSMTEYIGKKHLPFESAWFNGILKNDLDLQSDIMGLFGRDQAAYQAMARNGELTNDMDLVEELLASQGAYPAYFTLFGAGANSNSENPAQKINHIFASDEDGNLEALVTKHATFFHQPDTITLPKKQTLLFTVDLGDRVHAAHVYEAVKALEEDLGTFMRVGIIHSASTERQDGVGELVAAIIEAVGHSDVAAQVKLVVEALACVVKGKSLEATKSKLQGIIAKTPAWEADKLLPRITTLLSESTSDVILRSDVKASLKSLYNVILGARGKSATDATAHLYLNGFAIDLPEHPISAEDVVALTSYDMKHRSQPVAKAFIKRSVKYTAEEANARSMEILKASAIMDAYRKAERVSPLDHNESSIAIALPGDESLRVVAYVDPVSEAAQRMSSLLVMLHSQLNASVELLPLPASDYSEFPLQRFYRYLFDKKPSRATSIRFRRLPIKPILTMKIDTPEAWNVQVHQTTEDLDNLRVDADSPSDVRATKSASFQLESLLVYGQCRDKTFDMYSPPNGLQLVLERDIGGVHLHRDTLVMKNLGYFQLQATPGVWALHLARGRAIELFEIVSFETDESLPSMDIIVGNFGSRIEQLLVRKRPGMEEEELLAPTDGSKTEKASDVEAISPDAGAIGSYWNSMLSMFGKKGATKQQEQAANDSAVVPTTGANAGRTGETIHVFSLASGHLYERFVKIMMLSVLKRTKNPVTFWLLENFLSPDFKHSIPALREKFGMDIRLVTYKWPNWLRQQTQKQRIIWGYKILFLDVLFPLGVQKIIYVDADQVVRADLKELWEMDLQGAPYGYTPFCDGRNVGFQFWRQGYWKDHLRGRPYHISALYVVDLALFRQIAAGDMLRAIYDQLSADPNSLSNLDQDLPNYAQHQIRIHSLPQEWLWCESWCSDESKERAKTIDLCNNPKHKEPKLDMAKRVISGELFPESWVELDQEIRDAEKTFVLPTSA
ncbi:hypothetical protein Poli38472_004037 [Pythium oligandrum]|uniref:UDP-glucose:glycoprotein glucosyltransferase n=1 Tax=Pythium oligandrum TaxID=41045 RepID=A0A8K1FNV8_PYTOL|nr:hypothetical protein Poli38472_004037 [Pythium oligandrum]|eukprot:TMW66272.1 hypothetical protein Poli38472_004037 [Pythium oligandrum]